MLGIWMLLSGVLFGAPPDAPRITVWLDRTAVYPGDRIEYVARVEHAGDIEFVRDHVRKDQLALEPFEVLRVESSAGDLPAGRKYFEVKLLLTTYDVGPPEAVVPSFNLFYFRRSSMGHRDTSPAETLAVPAVKVGLRSTIVDLPGVLREEKAPLAFSLASWIVPAALGWIGLLAVLVYGSSRGMAWARSGFWKQKMTQRVRKKSLRESFEELRQMPVDSMAESEMFYSRASRLLRELAAERIGRCDGMTPGEIDAGLRETGTGDARASAFASLLEQCDMARYAPHGPHRKAESHPEFLEQFASVIDRHW